MMEFYNKIAEAGLGTLTSRDITKMQLDLCGFAKGESMSPEVLEDALVALQDFHIGVLEVEHRCPIMHEALFYVIEKAASFEKKILLHMHPALLLAENGKELLELLRTHKVAILLDFAFVGADAATLQEDVLYQNTILALKALNEAGYGIEDDLVLNLLYKPTVPVLPQPQAVLEQACKQALQETAHIRFHKLLVWANHPVGCFAKKQLAEEATMVAYQELLQQAFAAETVNSLPCLNQIYVASDGSIYDCAHSAAINLGVRADVNDIRFFKYPFLSSRPIQVAGHCFACTACNAE